MAVEEAIIIGLVAILCMLIYFANKLMDKDSFISKLFGFSLFSGSALIVVEIAFMLMKFSEGQSYYPAMRTLFIIMFVIMILLIFIFGYVLMAIGGVKVTEGAVEIIKPKG